MTTDMTTDMRAAAMRVSGSGRGDTIAALRERAEKAEAEAERNHRQAMKQNELRLKAEQERDEALTLLRDIDAGVYGMMPTQLNDRIAKLLREAE